MKRMLLLLLEVIFIAGLLLAMYWNYRDKKTVYRSSKLVVNTGKLQFLNRDLEENIIFFLTRSLGVYPGDFQIIEVVNLGTAELAGADYVLLTIRAPDGKIAQIALSKGAYPWSKWQVLPETFKVAEKMSSPYTAGAEDSRWMEELGITPQQVKEYYLGHPQMTEEELKSAFIDPLTGLRVLPDDWREAAGKTVHFKLETDKEKGFRFISDIAGGKTSDSYWKADYPGYVGPGYREYLYDKIQENRH